MAPALAVGFRSRTNKLVNRAYRLSKKCPRSGPPAAFDEGPDGDVVSMASVLFYPLLLFTSMPRTVRSRRIGDGAPYNKGFAASHW